MMMDVEKERAEERFSLALETGRIGVCEIDVREKRFYVDRSLCLLLEYDEGGLPEKLEGWDIVVPKEYLEKIVDGVQKMMEGKGPEEWSVTHPIKTKSGEELWVCTTWRGVEYGEDGIPDRIVTTVVDVTKLKAAQEEAERLSRVKSEFMAMISHELRTPLNALLGHCYLLKNTGLSEKQSEYVRIIGESADVLMDLIRDVLDFSKLEAQSLELECERFDLCGAIDGVVNFTRRRLDKRGVRMICDVEECVPREVMGDRVRVRQVLVNLLANAVKFTREGEVGLKCQVLRESEVGYRLRFEVWDTGIGISQEGLKRLFEPFVQVDLENREKHWGTGLGLAICRRLIGMMGGEMGVESELGKGSMFWFEVELGRVAEGDVAEVERHFEGVRVLLAEDSEGMRMLLRGVFENLGCIVDVADHGVEAVDKLGKGYYDVLVLDCVMPVMDGFEVMRRIREMDWRERRKPWVVAMTGHTSGNVKSRCWDAGADDYVEKPVGMAGLADVLERWREGVGGYESF